MRKLNFFVITLFSFLLFSCGSTKIQDLTDYSFVDTEISTDGELYTTCIFKSIEKVGYSSNREELNKSGGKEIKDYSYDSDFGKMIIQDKSLMSEKNVFHIEGVYQNPPVFVLHNNLIYNPFVAFEGKLLERGVDYDFDPINSKVMFKNKADLENDSFLIFWMTRKSECMFGNKIEKYENEYKNLVSEWYKTLE